MRLQVSLALSLIAPRLTLIFRIKYENGSLTEGPTPCAGNQGTTITFDDIFYNSPIRLKTLKFPSDEFQRIFDVTAKYAVHNHQISFALKKFGENNSIKTCPSSSPIDIIRSIYGTTVANSLLHVEFADENLKFSMNGLISKGDYSGKKRHFLLFINHRLVESKSLKKAIFDDIYNTILPNNVQPFVYMSLKMDPMNLDVNVSPTKHEVNFLNEDFIVEKVKEAVEVKLLETNETKKLYTQQLLPGAPSVSSEKANEEREKVYAKDMVRTDSKTQTIVKFLNPDKDDPNLSISRSSINVSQIITSPAHNKSLKKHKNISKLSSISELRKEITTRCDGGLRDQIGKLKFVGVASETKALVQCENILYLCDTQQLCLELFYQQSVLNFDNFSSFEFEQPLSIRELALIGFDMKECKWEETDGRKEDLAEQVKMILSEQRDILKEYFSITINASGELETLPIIIPSYLPLMAHLPLFIIRLACEVNYEEEKKCFRSIFEELASYYSRFSLISSDNKNLVEQIIYPEIRKNLSPPEKFLTDGTLLKLTSLQELYKVFERC